MHTITIPIKSNIDPCTILEIAQEIAEEIADRIEGGYDVPATVDIEDISVESK